MSYKAVMMEGAGIMLSGYFDTKAKSRAAFNQSYAREQQRINLRNAKVASEGKIAAIRQDTILSNVEIQLNQRQAEAQIQISAAARGAEGGSIDDMVFTTKSNEVMATARVQANADQQIDYEKAAIASQQSSLLQIQDEQENSYVGLALGTIAKEFLKEDSLLNENVAKLWGN